MSSLAASGRSLPSAPQIFRLEWAAPADYSGRYRAPLAASCVGPCSAQRSARTACATGRRPDSSGRLQSPACGCTVFRCTCRADGPGPQPSPRRRSDAAAAACGTPPRAPQSYPTDPSRPVVDSTALAGTPPSAPRPRPRRAHNRRWCSARLSSRQSRRSHGSGVPSLFQTDRSSRTATWRRVSAVHGFRLDPASPAQPSAALGSAIRGPTGRR